MAFPACPGPRAPGAQGLGLGWRWCHPSCPACVNTEVTMIKSFPLDFYLWRWRIASKRPGEQCSGTVASSAAGAGVEGRGTWTGSQSRIMLGALFVAPGFHVGDMSVFCTEHTTQREIHKQFSLGLWVASHSWSPTPDSEYRLNPGICSQGPVPNHL